MASGSAAIPAEPTAPTYPGAECRPLVTPVNQVGFAASPAASRTLPASRGPALRSSRLAAYVRRHELPNLQTPCATYLVKLLILLMALHSLVPAGFMLGQSTGGFGSLSIVTLKGDGSGTLRIAPDGSSANPAQEHH